MSKAAIIRFAETILMHFSLNRWDEEQEKAWAETMIRELGGFSTEVIERATGEMVRTRKKPQTPLPSECINACLDAKRWIEARHQAETLAIDHGAVSPQNRDWTAERLKLASELMNTPLGKQAAKEGWAGALWSFARKNARLPTQGKEIEDCKRAAKGFDEAYAICVRGAHNPMMAALEKLGAEMLRRRRVIEKRVLGGQQA